MSATGTSEPDDVDARLDRVAACLAESRAMLKEIVELLAAAAAAPTAKAAE